MKCHFCDGEIPQTSKVKGYQYFSLTIPIREKGSIVHYRSCKVCHHKYYEQGE
ncbi:MAG: hypothetical protein WCP20_10875 [Desulfuromonadales bacterium]